MAGLRIAIISGLQHSLLDLSLHPDFLTTPGPWINLDLLEYVEEKVREVMRLTTRLGSDAVRVGCKAQTASLRTKQSNKWL